MIKNNSQITRRHFCTIGLGASLGLGLSSLHPFAGLASTSACWAPPNELERLLLRNPYPTIIGRPQDWSLVRQGLHPFTPERVVVLPDDLRSSLTDQEVAWVTAKVARRFRPVSPLHDQQFAELCQTAKAAHCIRLVKIMSDYYHVPQHFLNWAGGLLKRESLASSSAGQHGGLVHQFQGSTPFVTMNWPLDWWLFLAPGGIDYQSFDDTPVHVLFGFVVSRTRKYHGATVEMGTFCFTSQFFHRDSSIDMLAVSCMDRTAAARHLNSQIPVMLENTPWHRFGASND